MQTQLIYLNDPYQKKLQAQVIDVLFEKEGTWRLILDQTIFYPMGGGQPTDQGVCTFSDGSQGAIYQVLLKDGQVNHYVKSTFTPEVGMHITAILDWERRFKNMRVHSAGHIIDFSVYLLGLLPGKLYPIKGDHGKKPFVLYQGAVVGDIKDALQKQVHALIASNRRFSWRFESLEVMQKQAIYLQPGLPLHKPLRALELEGVGVVADGGTIVAAAQEVGSVTVVAIEAAEGKTCIKYQVS